MIPQMTLFNGNGCEHSWNGYHIPLKYFPKIKRDNKFLVVMDVSKNKVVYSWYNEQVPTLSVGIRKHVPLLKDRRGQYFMVHGNKIRI